MRHKASQNLGRPHHLDKCIVQHYYADTVGMHARSQTDTALTSDLALGLGALRGGVRDQAVLHTEITQLPRFAHVAALGEKACVRGRGERLGITSASDGSGAGEVGDGSAPQAHPRRDSATTRQAGFAPGHRMPPRRHRVRPRGTCGATACAPPIQGGRGNPEAPTAPCGGV